MWENGETLFSLIIICRHLKWKAANTITANSADDLSGMCWIHIRSKLHSLIAKDKLPDSALLKSKPETEKTQQFNMSFGGESGDNYLFDCALTKLASNSQPRCKRLPLTVVHAHIYDYVRIWFDGCLLDISILSSASSFASCVNENQPSHALPIKIKLVWANCNTMLLFTFSLLWLHRAV